MAENDPKIEEKTVETTKKKMDPVRKMTLVILGVIIALLAWYLRADRVTPYTSQARLHSLVVPIAPEVSGIITDVLVGNNQFVDKGDALFIIDDTNYRRALQIAEAQYQAATEAAGASWAAVESARASLASAEANLVQAEKDVQRLRSIREQDAGAVSVRQLELSEASFASSQASVAAAQANLQRALEEFGIEGELNSRILQAQARLDEAKHDLSLTTVYAPSNGVVTGVTLDKGRFAQKGQAQMTFIATHDYWVQADYRENNLAHMDPGDKVEMVFDVYPGRIFKGTIREMGYGVSTSSVVPGSLPTITNDRDWLRDAQRFPVLIDFELQRDDMQKVLKVGSQVAVVTYTGKNPLSNILAKFYIRLIAVLTYAY